MKPSLIRLAADAAGKTSTASSAAPPAKPPTDCSKIWIFNHTEENRILYSHTPSLNVRVATS
jgi:hypothetical protein